MIGEKGSQCPPLFVIARHVSAEAISKLNPKLKALNSKQILISKFKTQNPFGHLDFGHLILFSISDLGFRVLLFCFQLAAFRFILTVFSFLLCHFAF